MANIQLAKNLKILREKYNLKQREISDALNISRQAYSNYERAIREPDLTTLVLFSNFYKISLDELVTGNLSCGHIMESFPVYHYHNSLSSDFQKTLYLTDEELDLIMQYRSRPENDQKLIRGFLDTK